MFSPQMIPQTAVDLGTAGDYVILAKNGMQNVGPSAITGDIAISAQAIAWYSGVGIELKGFTLTMDSGGQFSTSPQITGKAYRADYGSPVPAQLITAFGDMEAAYTDAAGRTNGDAARIDIGGSIPLVSSLQGPGGYLGATPATATFTPGVYTFSDDVMIDGNVTFSGSGTDIFIIQIAGVRGELLTSLFSLEFRLFSSKKHLPTAGTPNVRGHYGDLVQRRTCQEHLLAGSPLLRLVTTPRPVSVGA
jgi:hypothetical protein